MKIRRTSIKTALVALVLLIIYVLATWAAENFYERTTVIRFSIDSGRAWNRWDYIAIPALVLAVAFFAVSLMFANKDD